ncbi:hypothetical protein [Bdellovibrio sp. HCB288]|uniref:hypothetical protein n=1 Tax=Bdellovibrio sp. HCB288 TaxID=3394355 RepID=UPI0039B55409
MTTAITFVFIAICLVEIVLITREARRTPTNTLTKTPTALPHNEVEILSAKLSETTQRLEDAQREIQGINVLWNKSLQTEHKLRADLEVAKVQLTYLAQSLLKAKANSPQTAYWSEDEKSPELQAPAKRELRAFKKTAELAQKDFM